MKPLLMMLLIALGLAAPLQTNAERLKELATIQGVRENQLIGYGLVVGLDGSGDQTTQTPFTVQSTISMLSQLGVQLPPGISLQLKNVAAVMVTAALPPFARPGQTIDVTVSSIGNAKSLRGGTLLMAPLKGADGQIYAIAQGHVLVGGVGASSAGSQVAVNHLSVGRVPSGASVERAVATPVGQAEFIHLELKQTDFTNAKRAVDAINNALGAGTAIALDGRALRLRAPQSQDDRVAFLAMVENIEVKSAPSVAKVIVNARTGSIVMNQFVRVEPCAVAHGNLSVTISTQASVSQPNPLGQGQTTVTEQSQIDIKQDQGQLVLVQGVSLGDVIKALNAIGATPQDLLSILQAMKAAGSLRAELEII
jgi:flagellar P-ring protein FlgI